MRTRVDPVFPRLSGREFPAGCGNTMGITERPVRSLVLTLSRDHKCVQQGDHHHHHCRTAAGRRGRIADIILMPISAHTSTYAARRYLTRSGPQHAVRFMALWPWPRSCRRQYTENAFRKQNSAASMRSCPAHHSYFCVFSLPFLFSSQSQSQSLLSSLPPVHVFWRVLWFFVSHKTQKVNNKYGKQNRSEQGSCIHAPDHRCPGSWNRSCPCHCSSFRPPFARPAGQQLNKKYPSRNPGQLLGLHLCQKSCIQLRSLQRNKNVVDSILNQLFRATVTGRSCILIRNNKL